MHTPKNLPPPPPAQLRCCVQPQGSPPPPGGSAHFCLLPIINFLPRLTMLTPKDIEGQFICSDVILRQVRPDAVITAATLGVKLREPVWALWGSMRPLGEEAASRKRTAQGTPGSGHKAKKKAKPAAKKAKKAPGRCVEREEILRMAAQIEETRNVPMDVLKTYSKASLHALLEQFELYFPQSAKHDMLVLRLKQAVEAGKNRPRLVPPEMPAGAYGYSRLQEQAVDGTNVDTAHPEDCSPAYPFSYTTHKLRPARFL